MKSRLLIYGILMMAICSLSSCACNRVEPNHEGVLSKNFARNFDDYHTVTGKVGALAIGGSEKLYQVPMYLQQGQVAQNILTSRDGQAFEFSPRYQYQAKRGYGRHIIFNYYQASANANISQEEESQSSTAGEEMLDGIEEKVIDPMIIDEYRQVARNYGGDSLVNNMGAFEKQVEAILAAKFDSAFFVLKTLSANLKPPATMIEAIEKSNTMSEKIRTAKRELEISQINLQKSRIDAEADLAKTRGLTPAVLQQKWIDAIKPTDKVIVSDGKTPVILGGN